MASDIPALDFFDEIVNVNFGVSYLLVTVNATVAVSGQSLPPVPTVALSLAKNTKLVDKKETHSSLVTPPAGFTTVYFLWIGEASPFPTPKDYANVVTSGVTQGGFKVDLTYAFQFNAQFGGTTGSMSSLAAAQAQAAVVNAEFESVIGHHGISGVEFFHPDSTPENRIFTTYTNPVDWFGAQLVVPGGGGPGSAKVSFTGQYLLSIPAGRTTNSVSVQMEHGDVESLSVIAAAVYADFNGKGTLAAVSAATPDNQANVQALNAMITTTATGKGKGTVSIA